MQVNWIRSSSSASIKAPSCPFADLLKLLKQIKISMAFLKLSKSSSNIHSKLPSNSSIRNHPSTHMWSKITKILSKMSSNRFCRIQISRDSFSRTWDRVYSAGWETQTSRTSRCSSYLISWILELTMKPTTTCRWTHHLSRSQSSCKTPTLLKSGHPSSSEMLALLRICWEAQVTIHKCVKKTIWTKFTRSQTLSTTI